MNILIIGGFLGVGKTTALVAIAKKLSESQKCVIIENEVGKIGLDDKFLKENDLPVKEIYSGCICCTLRLDLINTLLEIERDINPDLVILEPSGVAGPKQIVSALAGYGGEINNLVQIALLDGERFHNTEVLSLPVINDGIKTADILVLNKIDAIDEEKTQIIDKEVQSIRPGASWFPLSATNGTGMPELIEVIETKLTKETPQKIPRQAVANHNPKLPGAIVDSANLELNFDNTVSGDDLTDKLAKSLTTMTDNLRDNGCTMIGHIKAIVNGQGSGYAMASITDFGAAPRCKGKLASKIKTANLTINAIAFGIEQQLLKEEIDRLTRTMTGTSY